MIAPTLRKVLRLGTVEVKSPDDVFVALEGYERGLDFADALHLASSGRAERFATFDRKLAKQVGTLQMMEIVAV
ncbi:MAG: hypothetical protein U1F70_13840 [Candidatus Competibacteraceae bacterium]